MALNILFLHQNFPGQYKLLATELGTRDDFKVVAFGQNKRLGQGFGRVRYESYNSGRDTPSDLFPPLTFFSEQVRRGDVVRWRLIDLKKKGFSPDLCFVHPGWGEALFVRDVFPHTKLISHLEYYYGSKASDLDFDAEFQVPSMDMHYVSLRNLPTLQAAALSDMLVSSTRWQAKTFPGAVHKRITVVHEGVDTAVAKPGPAEPLLTPSGRAIQPGQILITYVARTLEPYRGFHTFMRSLPHLMRLMPSAQVAIVGKEQGGYGRAPSKGGTWKQAMLGEVGSVIDLDRVHFLGTLPYRELINLFRLSTVHVYLTYPFILSWSLLEAMACGCAIVGSATGPVSEVVHDGQTGVLTDFFDTRKLAETIADLAESQDRRALISVNARRLIVDNYDFRTVCLPAYERLIEQALDA